MSTKKEVIREHLKAYCQASRAEKTVIINSVTKVLKQHRKSVIRSFRREQMSSRYRPVKKSGPKVYYTKDVTAALHEVWAISRELCAERLHPIVSTYIEILKRDQMWSSGDGVTDKLIKMSLGTMKRRISGFLRIKAGGGRSTTRPSDLKRLVPIRSGPWKDPKPGYGEIDTVVHCGDTLSGIMAYTLNFTDIATLWGESTAQLNKGKLETLTNLKLIKKRLPFPLLGLNSDTGTEFVNWHCYNWTVKVGIEFTRSRPNHSNDNAHIEQRNYTGVRKFLGYSRIDDETAVVLLNQLYAGPLRLYRNFFQPSVKCIGKQKLGSRYVRRYDKAQTPYQRVLSGSHIDQAVKDKLTVVYVTLNPKLLLKEVDEMIIKIFKIQRALHKDLGNTLL